MTTDELKKIIAKGGGRVPFGEIFGLMLRLYNADEEIPDDMVSFAISEQKVSKHHFYCGEKLYKTLMQAEGSMTTNE